MDYAQFADGKGRRAYIIRKDGKCNDWIMFRQKAPGDQARKREYTKLTIAQQAAREWCDHGVIMASRVGQGTRSEKGIGFASKPRGGNRAVGQKTPTARSRIICS